MGNIDIYLRCALTEVCLRITLFVEALIVIIFILNEFILKLVSAFIFLLRIFIGTEIVLLSPTKVIRDLYLTKLRLEFYCSPPDR